MLQEIVKQLRSTKKSKTNNKRRKTEPWTLKVALRRRASITRKTRMGGASVVWDPTLGDRHILFFAMAILAVVFDGRTFSLLITGVSPINKLWRYPRRMEKSRNQSARFRVVSCCGDAFDGVTGQLWSDARSRRVGVEWRLPSMSSVSLTPTFAVAGTGTSPSHAGAHGISLHALSRP